MSFLIQLLVLIFQFLTFHGIIMELILSTNNVTRADDQYLYISTLYLISASDTNSGEYICEAHIVEDKKLVMNSTNVNVQGQYSNCQLQQLYFLLAI